MRKILWAFLLAPLPAWTGESAAIHIKVETNALDVSECREFTYDDRIPSFRCEAANVSDAAISAVTYGVTAYDPGRSIQWMSEHEIDIRIRKEYIRGGIEPGESMTFTMRFLSLPDRADPSNIEFTMHFTEAYDAEGEPLP